MPQAEEEWEEEPQTEEAPPDEAEVARPEENQNKTTAAFGGLAQRILATLISRPRPPHHPGVKQTGKIGQKN